MKNTTQYERCSRKQHLQLPCFIAGFATPLHPEVLCVDCWGAVAREGLMVGHTLREKDSERIKCEHEHCSAKAMFCKHAGMSLFYYCRAHSNLTEVRGEL